ncbi:hypothetical protein V6N12_022787 [Hibiscus sabdariffa]|uniref:G protein gamma domain-containing protein n=1 Tax=Hibiscus sabdariffa TaxID=183260 RepID=A0ABR2FVQ8_9ROSI
MESETASSTDELQPSGSAADTRGKHRILAELKRVEQESRFLEDEVEELERTDNVSTLSEETNGPINPSWDRWFEGPQNSKGCRCQIL